MVSTGQLPLTGKALLWFQQGLVFAAAQEYEKAIISFNSVIQERPEFYEAWFERGLSLEALGLYREAILNYDQALQLTPPLEAVPVIWQERGDALQYGLGSYEDAIASYDHVLRHQPDSVAAWQHRGNAFLYGLCRYEEAISSYNRAILLDPTDPLSWRNRGNALAELKRYEEAVASYDRALSINADDEVARQARMLVIDRAGLDERQPTTNPSWYGRGYTDATFVGDQDESEDALPPEDNGLHRPFRPRLVIEDDRGQWEVSLEKDLYSIGRDPRNDICLNSQFASRQHATLMQITGIDGGTLHRIVDGNLQGKPSTNGLIINGQKCHTYDLKPGDVVVFGPQVRATFYI